ncbi:hypothetical protein [Erythrobacter ani]|uniref:Lipoprotein n=1 Tax=Erythrobacter ani TaxID=2827235 RepID=A0ABS6SLS1_9SPHN|nr:hypothetical protein [Erythrobacter ani]MBV7265983.1 hypothetical protein [Erythrobacter ani]
MRRYICLSSILFAVFPAAASACAVFIEPAARIEQGLASGTIQAVAAVQIIDARHIREPEGDTHPWIATAKITEILQGSGLPESIQFERGWGSAACEWNLPSLPEKGDRWVLYFWKDRLGRFRPWLELTAAEARAFDPGFLTR